jgi:hypothetical protein
LGKVSDSKRGLKYTRAGTILQIGLVNITEAKIHDQNGIGQLVFSKGTIIVEDRAYFDLMLHRIAENILLLH